MNEQAETMRTYFEILQTVKIACHSGYQNLTLKQQQHSHPLTQIFLALLQFFVDLGNVKIYNQRLLAIGIINDQKQKSNN